ncbi:MAG: UvrB/UvrC motif-containing protein [Terracidiphilus sp.]
MVKKLVEIENSMEQILFDPADPKAALAALPQSPAVFALHGADTHAEPYIGRTPNLNARLARLLQPSAKHPRRLQLAGRVRRIAWQLTGSEFESLLTQFSLLEQIYGAKSLDRMHLRAPAFIRYLGGNPYPRIVVTNRANFKVGQREADWAYGPFPSRAAAERYAEEALKLFLLRRCTFDLDPDPSYPGCVYSEMQMCLAPCYKGCTDERYAEEATAVQSFLATCGESRLVTLRTQRDQASANLEFESAAQIHAQVQRVESVRALASELVRPLSQLRAVILQASAQPDEVSVFLFEDGRLRGPAKFSTLGMRIQNEQSGSSSLFAQPMALEPIPEEAGTREQGLGNRDQGSGFSGQGMENGGQEARIDRGASQNPLKHAAAPDYGEALSGGQEVSGHDFSRAENSPNNEGALAPEGSPAPQKIPRSILESRMEGALATLSQPETAPTATLRQGHLALLKRWYYRPEARRTGEIFFPDREGHWPIKAILRGAGRVAAGRLKPASSGS